MTATTINEEAEALKEAGNKLVVEKKYVEALKKYKKAASIDPSRAAYYGNMAFCYDKMGELRNFEKASRDCIDADPSFVRGYQRLASALEQLWEFDEAMETVEKGLGLDPTNKELRMIRSVVEVHLERRNYLEKDVLSAEPSNLPFFGGLPPNRTCQIPADSLYGSLERKSLPLQAKKLVKKLESGKHDYSEGILPVARAFFTGDLRIEWAIDNTNKFLFLNTYLMEQVDTGPVMTLEIKLVYLGNNPNGHRAHKIRVRGDIRQNPTYSGLITDEMGHSFQLILLQRFVRQKAFLLAGRDGDYEAVSNILTHITENLLEYGLFQDVADLKMVLTDVIVNLGQKDVSTVAAVHLGEALEAAKNYTSAAKVYIEVAEGRIFPINPEVCPEIRARIYAGLAFKRAQDYVRAEEQYVAALRSKGNNWTFKDGDDTDIGNALNNMMIYYEVVHRAVQSRQLIDQEHRKIERVCLLLVGLLSIAGYQGNGGCTLFRDGYKIFQGYLKREYKKPKKALRAIVAAFSTPSIAEYRKVLFDCSEYNTITLIAGDDEFYRESHARETVKAKQGAREQFFKINNEAVYFNEGYLRCNGCDDIKPKAVMKNCPCRTVWYCSRECQLAHWKIHKRVCQHRKTK
jgi:tetratricopeptide (TPR) repeat protein